MGSPFPEKRHWLFAINHRRVIVKFSDSELSLVGIHLKKVGATTRTVATFGTSVAHIRVWACSSAVCKRVGRMNSSLKSREFIEMLLASNHHPELQLSWVTPTLASEAGRSDLRAEEGVYFRFYLRDARFSFGRFYLFKLPWHSQPGNDAVHGMHEIESFNTLGRWFRDEQTVSWKCQLFGDWCN